MVFGESKIEFFGHSPFEFLLLGMRIGINASFLRKQNTGIGQVSANFLKKLSELSASELGLPDKNVEFFLYLEEEADLKLSEGDVLSAVQFHKRVFLPPYRRDDLIRKIWWEKHLLPKKIAEDKCDAFLSLYQSATILPNNLPHIMVVHDIVPKLFPEYLNNWRKKIYQKFIEKAIKKTDKIIAVSHRTEKDLIQHMEIVAEKITVAYVDVDEIYKKEVSDEERQRVLEKYKLEAGYIFGGGGLEVRKNVESVLRAYKILAEQIGHLGKLPKLVIFGKLMPELAPLATDAVQLAEGLDIQNHTVMLGQVPQEDLPALYKNASMFVYPSKYEGFGVPVLEAMAQGTPAITAKTSSLPEVGADSVLYCNPDDIDDLAMVMKNLMNNEHLRTALSMKGKERAAHFSWEKFTRKVLNIVFTLKKRPEDIAKEAEDLDL